MKILDATAGSRGIWVQKNHPYVTFMDKRKGKFVSYQSPKDKRTYEVNPDVVASWDNMPFKDETFDMVVFDPPHIIKKQKTPSRLEIQYSYLDKDIWRKTLKDAFINLFRVLKQDGIFILKWCESNKPIEDIIALSPYPPLFANKTINHNPKTKDSYMVVFLKYDVNEKLNIN